MGAFIVFCDCSQNVTRVRATQDPAGAEYYRSAAFTHAPDGKTHHNTLKAGAS
jgi:hypothetical protein